MVRHRAGGFTLIELLIVVAIIGILAAIAVPNFLEAQTRSKVARVKAEFRNLGAAIEMYMVDNDVYPWYDNQSVTVPEKYWAVGYRLRQLTTPIAYMAELPVNDPFIKEGVGGGYPDDWLRDQYNYRSYAEFGAWGWTSWALNSLGPDHSKNQGLKIEPFSRGITLDTVVYDSSNGTVSDGDIPWTGGDTRHQNR